MVRLHRMLLRVAHIDGDMIIGEDEDAQAWEFNRRDVSTFIMDRKREAATVVYRQGSLRKLRQREYAEKAPVNENLEPDIVRDCLLCGHTFKAHPEHRICQPCKSTSNWRLGPGYSLVS